jgi:hypothetical protein
MLSTLILGLNFIYINSRRRSEVDIGKAERSTLRKLVFIKLNLPEP